jgi:hypothetical protein
MNDIKQKYSFSQPNYFKLIANHGEKAIYLLIVIGVFFTYQDLKGQFLIDVTILIIVLFLFLAIIGKFISRIIWRIDIDLDKKKIVLYLCRNASPIPIVFNKIEQIKVSGPIVFLAGNKKYYYSTKDYEEILTILNNIKKIAWGKMCNILGPDKSIRELIDRMN